MPNATAPVSKSTCYLSYNGYDRKLEVEHDHPSTWDCPMIEETVRWMDEYMEAQNNDYRHTYADAEEALETWNELDWEDFVNGV